MDYAPTFEMNNCMLIKMNENEWSVILWLVSPALNSKWIIWDSPIGMTMLSLIFFYAEIFIACWPLIVGDVVVYLPHIGFWLYIVLKRK